MPLQSLRPTRDDVLHKSKRAVAPSPQVAELIARLLGTPNDDLSRVLAEIDAWKWPRSDLNAWIKVLNKFDAIMEEIIRDYQVDKLQVNVFTPATKATLCEILRFERLLLENSTNRKMFHSYDRLNGLLFTPDLDILILPLNWPSRQLPMLSTSPLPVPNLPPNAGPACVNTASASSTWQVPSLGALTVDALPADARQVHSSFYRTKEDAPRPGQMDTDTEPESSPRQPVTTTSSNAVGIHVDSTTIVLRLLAVAIFRPTHPEPQAATSLFLYEPDVINHMAELLQTDKGIPVAVHTAAHVLTAVNAGVDHGLLMSMVRALVIPHVLRRSTVGAGLIPLLIQNKLPNRLPLVSKTMQLVDNVLYSFTNAFSLFCAARGVAALVQRIEYEIDVDLKEFGDEQRAQEVHAGHMELHVARAGLLKHVLRSIHRMMQSSGTAEGLRGLIDMSILASLKKIIKYRGLFGPTVVPLAINIMATFIHNEPTSLAIIQEAGLPQVFFKTIEVGLEPSIEVIQAIPNAIGALCLNEAGVAQLEAHPSVIPAIFSIFSSEQHLKVLLDKENAVLIGTTIDELIRHHPFLKGQVFEAIKATLGRLEILGEAFIAPVQIQQWYKLVDLEVTSEGDVPMADVDAPNVSSTTDAPRDNAVAPAAEEGPAKTTHDNNIVSFVDALLRFLEGLFQHTPHCKDFITSADGLERLGRITSLPCIPYDFANSVASDSLVQVMRTMAEVTTPETLAHLSKLVKESLEATKDFWETLKGDSKLLPLVDLAAERSSDGNRTFRELVTLHIRITLLSDVFATAGYAHGRAAISLLQTFMSSTSPEVIKYKGIEVASSPLSSPLEGTPEQTTAPLPDSDVPAETSAAPAVNGVQTEEQSTTTTAANTPPPQPAAATPAATTSGHHNAAALKHLTQGLPNSLAPFFQAMVKLFRAQRNPDCFVGQFGEEEDAEEMDESDQGKAPNGYALLHLVCLVRLAIR
ncbi:hypothetical protein MKEN_00135300 [Mycena kentingensis (nom. inval.)]|nr:hypothetical protein MKEN_00135300 [Mycena kentingensis (nom. inval.)]